MAPTELRLIANGIEQAALAWGPLDGPPVLLIHGNCSSAAFWEPLVRVLPPHWRIVAPDLRGYGHTAPAPVDATRGLRDFADDVAALLGRAGRCSRPAARPVVAGHSMGGGVAMQLVGRPPRSLRRAAAGGAAVAVRVRRYPRPDRHADHCGLRRYGRRRRQPRVRPPARRRRPDRRRCGQPAQRHAGDLRGGRRTRSGPTRTRCWRACCPQWSVTTTTRATAPPSAELAADRARRARRAQHDVAPVLRPGRRAGGAVAQAAGRLDPRRRRRDRLRHLAVRPGVPGSARRGARLARRRGLPAAADGRPDPGRAGALRGRRRARTGRSSTPASATRRTSSGPESFADELAADCVAA